MKTTGCTLDDLKEAGYPVEVLEALDCLTRRGGEAYQVFIERARSNPLARRVKLAGLEDNLSITRLPSVTESDVQRLSKYLRARVRLNS